VKRPTWTNLTLVCLVTIVIPINLGSVFLWVNEDPKWVTSLLFSNAIGLLICTLRIWIEQQAWRKYCERRNQNLEGSRPNLAVRGGAVRWEDAEKTQQGYNEARHG